MQAKRSQEGERDRERDGESEWTNYSAYFQQVFFFSSFDQGMIYIFIGLETSSTMQMTQTTFDFHVTENRTFAINWIEIISI